MLTAVKRVLEGIAMAKVSTSALEARGLGLLLPADRITMNRERLLLEAKAQAVGAGRDGLHCAAAANGFRAGHCGAGHHGDGHLFDGRGRIRERARPEGGASGRRTSWPAGG